MKPDVRSFLLVVLCGSLHLVLLDAQDCQNFMEVCFPGYPRPCCRGYECNTFPVFRCVPDGTDRTPRACQGSFETCIPGVGKPCCSDLVCETFSLSGRPNAPKRCINPRPTTPRPCGGWLETCHPYDPNGVQCCHPWECMSAHAGAGNICEHPVGR